MKLVDFLSTLTIDAIVVIKDIVGGKTIAEIRATGYTSLDDKIEERTVAQWSIITSSKLEVILNVPVTTNNTQIDNTNNTGTNEPGTGSGD